jgi:hypothetical protein
VLVLLFDGWELFEDPVIAKYDTTKMNTTHMKMITYFVIIFPVV